MRRNAPLFLLLAVLVMSSYACNSHELTPFSSNVAVGITERTAQRDVKPVDILFMVDDSNSMCEEQSGLTANFNAFLEGLAAVDANFHLAVANSDMVANPGQFQTGPGTYNAFGCPFKADLESQTAECSGRSLPNDGILRRESYGSLSDPTVLADLQADFRCLALTGIDGNTVEMGLDSVRRALETGKNNGFLRTDQGALLSVVFVTDENDCSDGTNGANAGAVYSTVQSDSGNDRQCEFSRNIEDSCVLDNTQVSHTYTNSAGAELTESKTVSEWCAMGDRGVVEALVNAGSIQVDCGAAGTCTNSLTPRQDFYNFFTKPIGACAGDEALSCRGDFDCTDIGDGTCTLNGEAGLGYPESDLIIASIINVDTGDRRNSGDEGVGGQLPAVCGSAGFSGYRYDLFTKMFNPDQSLVSAVCDTATGDPAAFAEPLGLIADIIGAALNNICLAGEPATCSSDDDCSAGQACDRTYLAGTEYEYSVCSGFTVVVGTEDAEGVFTPLAEDAYTVNYEGINKCNPSPILVNFNGAVAGTITVKYSQTLGRDVN